MALTLTSVFADLPDPRTEPANKIHHLTDILTIATCAVIAGAESWEDIAEYGRSKEAFFRRFLELPNGVPSHDTFYRVFTKLDPDAFADRFARWVAEVGETTGLTRPDTDGPTRPTWRSTGRVPAGPGSPPSPGACTWSRRGPSGAA